ncbi:MAG: PEP-CTERM sorting domain-containing protein [Armatimonadota bacterium]|nr:PEP-CTERM sorting domain-containing protein [Armatimonadota bacterium]
MRAILAIVILVAVFIISASAVFAGGKARSNTPSWVAGLREINGPVVPSGHFIAPRHKWYRAPIQSDEGFSISREQNKQKWYKRVIQKDSIKHKYVFNENSKYREVNFRYVSPNGMADAVPEPSSLIGLAGPALGTLLYFRRRRTS